MKTNQEIFDIVAKHLLTQRAVSETDIYCTYRGNDGLKCAAGVLIPDDKYTPALERKTVDDLRVQRAMPDVDVNSIPLVARLQKIHDGQPVAGWESCLRGAADDYDLVFNAEAYGLPADQS